MVRGGPGVGARLILTLEDADRPGLWVSERTSSALLQTVDQGAIEASRGVGGVPYELTVIDLETGEQQSWDVVDTVILDAE